MSYRSGLLMSQRIDSLHPPGESSELPKVSRLLPAGADFVSTELSEVHCRYSRQMTVRSKRALRRKYRSG